MTKLFFILISMLCLFSAVDAFSVSNAIYSSSLNPGGGDSFTFMIVPDAGQPVSIESISVSGDAASWVKVDKTSIPTTNISTPIKASISVPKGTYGGDYEALVKVSEQPTGTPGGMGYRMSINVPVRVHVSGPEAPAPAPTAAITAAPTTKEPVSVTQQAPEALPSTPAAPMSKEPLVPIWVSALVIYLMVAFGIVLIWSEYRERKKK
jgi:hypothetical protein